MKPFIALCFVLSTTFLFAQNFNKPTLQNPILKGFYPDPSICRVGEDYYLVTSSFEYEYDRKICNSYIITLKKITKKDPNIKKGGKISYINENNLIFE